MSSDECLSLSDSAYEVIHTDGESQDGHATESVCSLDVPHSDDVQSLTGEEIASNEEDDDNPDAQYQASMHVQVTSSPEQCPKPRDYDFGSSSVSASKQSLEYTHTALRTPSPSQSIQSVDSLDHSIKLKEISSASTPDRVLASHILHVLDNHEKSRVCRAYGSQKIVSISATVRQTMSTQNMMISGPFRILYVGSESAQHDILYKISSALISPTYPDQPERPPSTSDRVFNIVPVSDFGAAQTPDVELMPTSPFQVMLETCIEASENLSSTSCRYQLNLITANHEERGVSLPCNGSPALDHWELPHLAVFYCTENDEPAALATRDAVWGAMKSYNVPCMFIAHHIDYEHPPTGSWLGHLEMDVLHISLEPEQPDSPDSALTRLPVDLATFLAIDARQIHRHLAFITPRGLGPSPITKPDQKVYLESSRYLIYKISTILALLALSYMVGFLNLANRPPQHVDYDRASPTISTTTATITIERTSTKTVEVYGSVSSVVPWFFDQMLWPMPEAHLFQASIGPNSVLLEVDAAYTQWVVPERIQVSVMRGNEPIAAKVIVHDGRAVVVELDKRDAWGDITIYVETTQRPKVQETYDIDFGTYPGLFTLSLGYLQRVAMDLAAATNMTLWGAPQGTESESHIPLRMLDPQALSLHALGHRLGVFRGYLAHRLAAVGNEANRQLCMNFQSALPPHSVFDMALRKAQISSKLLWLKMRGHDKQRERYEQQAIEYLAKKVEGHARQSFSAVGADASPGLSRALTSLRSLW